MGASISRRIRAASLHNTHCTKGTTATYCTCKRGQHLLHSNANPPEPNRLQEQAALFGAGGGPAISGFSSTTGGTTGGSTTGMTTGRSSGLAGGAQQQGLNILARALALHCERACSATLQVRRSV